MANGQLTSVSLQGMQRAEGNFQTAVSQCTTAYSSMNEQISALRGAWSGEAASTYLTAMETWLEDFNTVKQQLTIMLNKLESTLGDYSKTHESTITMAGQAQSMVSRGLPNF